ncbi:MAG: STAS domain-containing protein [Vulcanimicrobiota bacterium]
MTGNLNEACYTLIDELLDRSEGGPPRLPLDLSQITQLDMRGVSWLLSLHRQLSKRGQKLQILRPSRQIKSILRQLHLTGRPTARVRQA